MSEHKFRVGKNTVQHGGMRFKPILFKHGAHSEIVVMVRTDDDDNNEISNGICEFLNDAFDQEQLPSEMAQHYLHWIDLGDKEEAKHPDFEDRAKYVISRLGARFQLHIVDEKTENGVMEVGAGYQNIYHARSAAEAHLATNRALRRQHE